MFYISCLVSDREGTGVVAPCRTLLTVQRAGSATLCMVVINGISKDAAFGQSAE